MIGKGKVVQSVSVIVSVPEHVSSVLWMCLCDRLTSKQKIDKTSFTVLLWMEECDGVFVAEAY